MADDFNIPEPNQILLGCQAWPAPSRAGGGCPACGAGVHRGDDRTYCAVCDGSSPWVEGKLVAARVGLVARDKADAADKKVARVLAKHRTELSESERRRIWIGHKGGVLGKCPDIANRTQVGRDWLVRIGQEPDWDLDLTRRDWREDV